MTFKKENTTFTVVDQAFRVPTSQKNEVSQ